MARRRPKNTDADAQGQAAPAAAGARRASGPGSRSPRPRPGPQSRQAKAGSVTKSVQRSRISQLVTEVMAELRKVNWPTRTQLLQATLVVIVAVAIIAAFLGVADAVSEWITDQIF